MVDICLESGVNLFDTADVYSDGAAETTLGAAIAGRHHEVIEGQLPENLGAVGWARSSEQMATLDASGPVTPPHPYYPYWNGQFAEGNPPPISTPPCVRDGGELYCSGRSGSGHAWPPRMEYKP